MGGTASRRIVIACALLAGCGEAASSPEDRTGANVAPLPEAPPEPVGRRERAAFVNSAQRCGECHESASLQWEGSAHARSAQGPAYLAMRGRLPDRASECVPCHAPLTPWVPEDDPLAAEGVSCDGCHAVRDVVLGDVHATMDLRLDDNVKYGPLCDAEDHYFHRMGCSELHTTGRLCAGCHDLSRTIGDREIPIYTEYREWRDGPYAEEGTQCQSCHMPESTGEVATGAGEREGISHHGFLGSRGDLRSRALELTVRATGQGDAVELRVSLRNRRAGHRVPSGMPGRQIVVRARALDGTGHELARGERTLARVLVDDQGREVAHHAATRVASDERIGPRETVEIPITLAASSAGEVIVEVVWREMSDALARELGLGAPREERLAEARMTIGPPAARRRVGRATVVEGSTE